jgi:hypothetical protein
MQLSAAVDDQCVVTVCRGCCCGDSHVNPGVDHDELLRDLTAELRGAAEVRISDCLLLCGEANVVVVSPPPRARRPRAQVTWFKAVLDREANRLIVDWIRTGGPGQPLSVPLSLHLTSQPRLVRDASGRTRVVHRNSTQSPGSASLTRSWQ